MELKQIKKNIWYILTIIGTSCGVIGGWFTCAVLAHELEEWFIFWSGVVTVVGMVIGTAIWCIDLIIEVRKYRKEKKFAGSVIEVRYWDFGAGLTEAERQYYGLMHKKEKQKEVENADGNQDN